MYLVALPYLKKYEISDSGKRIKNKYIQQGIRGIFVGFPEDSSGWLFYVPDTKRTYISLDAVFDENFTSPLSMPELPFQGALKIRGTSNYIPDTTGSPSGENESYPDDLILNPCHHVKSTRYGHNDSPTNNRNYSGHSYKI